MKVFRPRAATRLLAVVAVAAALGIALAPRANAVTFNPPAPLDFGTVSVGATSAPQSVTLDATPTGPTTVITNVALVPGSPFAITNTTCNTTPSPSACNVAITFSPVGAGATSGTLEGTELNTFTGLSTPFTYQLEGTGTAPPPVLPEAPDPRLLPLVAAALFGAALLILRRRATAAARERTTH